MSYTTGGRYGKGLGRGRTDPPSPFSPSAPKFSNTCGGRDAKPEVEKNEQFLRPPNKNDCKTSRPIPGGEEDFDLIEDDFNIPVFVKSASKNYELSPKKFESDVPNESSSAQNGKQPELGQWQFSSDELSTVSGSPKAPQVVQNIKIVTKISDESDISICGDKKLKYVPEKCPTLAPPIKEFRKCTKLSIIPAGEEDFGNGIDQSENIMHLGSVCDKNFTFNGLRYIIRSGLGPEDDGKQSEFYYDCKSGDTDSVVNSEHEYSMGDRISDLSSDYERLKSRQYILAQKRMQRLREFFLSDLTVTSPNQSDVNGDKLSLTSSYVSAQQNLLEYDDTFANHPQLEQVFATARKWFEESTLFENETFSYHLQTTLRAIISEFKTKGTDSFELSEIQNLTCLIEKMFSGNNGFSLVDEKLCFPPDTATQILDMGFPSKFVERVSSLMDKFPFGVHYQLFPSEFQECYGYSLDHEGYGYNSVKALYNDLNSVFTFAESKLFKQHLHQMILFPTSIVDSIVELDVLVVRLWHWILRQVCTEAQGFAVVESFSERYAAQVMPFKPSIWGFAKDVDGWVAFIKMMLDYADYQELFFLGSTTVKNRTIHVLYRASNSEFVQEWILDTKKKRRGRYRVKKSLDEVTVTVKEDTVPLEDPVQSMVDNEILEAELRDLFETKNQIDQDCKPWEAIDFLEEGEHYMDETFGKIGSQKFASEFNQPRTKGDEMVKGEIKACLFRDAIVENLDFWLVNALDWEHVNGIHNYMNTESEYSVRSVVESEEFLLHPNEVVVGLWVAVSSKLLGKREWYRGRVADILTKKKFDTSATTKTNDIIVSADDDDELFNQKLASQAFKEKKRSCGKLGDTRNSWLQSDRCYRVHLIDVGHSGLYTIDEMRRLTSDILHMAPVMSFRARFNLDCDFLKKKWSEVKKNELLKRMDALIPSSYVTIIFHDYFHELNKTKGGHVESRKIWTVSVVIKDFSDHGILVPDLLKRIIRIDQGAKSKDYSNIEYLRSFITVRRRGNVPDIDEGEEIVEQ